MQASLPAPRQRFAAPPNRDGGHPLSSSVPTPAATWQRGSPTTSPADPPLPAVHRWLHLLLTEPPLSEV
jgi:hypothetical protein